MGGARGCSRGSSASHIITECSPYLKAVHWISDNALQGFIECLYGNMKPNDTILGHTWLMHKFEYTLSLVVTLE